MYCVYGQTNGEHSDDAAAWISDCLSSILCDAQLQTNCPIFIVGDLNATLDRLPPMQDAINQGKFYDLGAIASKYGGTDNMPTCKNNETTIATRRDYVLANAWGQKPVKNHRIEWVKGLPTHAIISIDFHECIPDQKVQEAVMPTTIKSIFEDVCESVYGDTSVQRHTDK